LWVHGLGEFFGIEEESGRDTVSVMVRKIINKLVPGLFLAGMVIGLSGCLPLAAGAAAGYIAHDQGYRVQTPLKKTDE
jgi:hypothetical protein